LTDLKQVTVYTDGGCFGNPGPGGYAAVLVSEGRRKVLTGGRRLTTNNRMEILAAIAALEALKNRCRVTVRSDSKYLVDAVQLGWAAKWRSKGWMRNKKERAENADLWVRLLELTAGHEVTFEWVRGHAGNPENEFCDRAAAEALQAAELPADEPYEQMRQTATSGPLFGPHGS
jgi:ribonuclease HI